MLSCSFYYKNIINRNILLTDYISLFPIRIFIFHQRIVYSFSLVNGSLRTASRERKTKINKYILFRPIFTSRLKQTSSKHIRY